MIALRAEALLLNAALGVGIGLLVSWGTKKITEAAQRVQNVATESKEAADAAQSTTSSLKDLVSAYEELGDKSGWGTEDFDQAKDIQAEILDLAKEQGTLDENKLGKLDLQNGKYEEQLGLLQDITAEQLEASRYELTQNKDAQGDKLVDTAKKNNRTHYLTVWSAPEMDMGDQIKNAGIDVFNKFGGYGPDDLNDADSVVDYYNEVGKALKYVIDNTTEAERAAGGTYHSLYQFLLDEQSALRDDVDSYNDSTDAINNNTNARRKLQAVDFWQNDNNNSMDVSFTFDKVNSAVQTLEDTIDGFDASKLNELLWGTNEGLSDDQAQALANLRKALTDMDFSADTNGVNAFIQALVQVGIVAQSSANGVDAVAQASQKMEDISSEIDEIQTAYKNATTAIDEYNKYGYLSADTLQTLLNEDFEYLSCLELVDGQLQVNTEKYQGMIAAQYQSAAMALVEKANAELAKIAQGEKKDAVEDATKATEDQATALTERVCPALGEFAKASMTAAAAQEFLTNGDAAWSVDPERTKEVYAGLASGLNILDATVDQIMGNSDKFRQHMNGFDKETKNRNKNTAKSVTDVASAFDTLNKAMKEYNQYGYLCADTAKSLVGLDDKFTACLTKQGNKLQINVEQFRKFVKEQLKEANAAKDGGKSADEMNKILNYLDQNVDTTTISFEQLTDAIKGYGTAMDEAKEKTDAIKSAFSGLYDIQQKIKNSQFGVGDLDATESKIESILQLSKFFGDNKDLMDNLVDKNGNINLNTEAFKKATLDELDKRIKAANETGGAAATALANSLSSDKANIESGKISVSDYLVGLGTDLEHVNTELDKYQTNWSTLKDAMDEWNTTGQLTQDTMQKLQELPEEFSNLLTYDEDGNAKIDVKALRQSYVDKLSAFAKEFEGSPIGIQVQAMIDDVREPTHDEYVELAKKTATYQKVLAQYTKKMSAIDSNKDLSEDEALQQKAEVQKELDDALEKALLEVQETDAQVTTKLKKHWDGVEKVIEEFKSALSDAKAILSSFLSLLSTLNDKSNNDLKIWGDAMGKVIDKRIKALNKQKEALEENNEATERAIELSKAQDALARAQQQRTTRVYTENGYEWQANAEDVRTAREDLADKGNYAAASHTHNYAGSGTAGGSANSAVKLDSSAGSATQPVYFKDGKPVATTYTLNKTVPADAKFTDTDTWRGIQNNLTSDSTDQSLSAAQGKALKTLVDGKAPISHTHKKSQITDFPSSMPASDVYAWAKAATKPSYTKAEVGLGNVDNTADKNKSVNYATSAGLATNAQCLNNDDKYMKFHWSGQKGQPTWLWGGNDSGDMYVYNPSNFNVNYATTAGNGTVDFQTKVTTDGYFGAVRFGNGVQICWFTMKSTRNRTFLLPFADINYAIAFSGGYCWLNINNRTTTGFTVGVEWSGYENSYIAIGRWK